MRKKIVLKLLKPFAVDSSELEEVVKEAENFSPKDFAEFKLRLENLPRRTGNERCVICGKPCEKMLLLECCGQLFCGVSRRGKSCAERHDRYTLCANHHLEKHSGSWKECKKCRKNFETEMYVWYGTNKHNWEKLENPPKFEPKKCAGCNEPISLTRDPVLTSGDDYFCIGCVDKAE